MTREDAIYEIKQLAVLSNEKGIEHITEALEMAIEALHIDLDDYVPKDFHDKTCEAMAKRHQEEIAEMVSVVRCKECYMCDEKMWCSFYDSIMEDDDYCSYGEREGE